MEKVISTLYDIEEKANQILDRAAAEKTELNRQLSEDMEKLDAQMDKKLKAQLGRLKSRMDEEVSTEMTRLVTENKKHLERVEAHFNACHSEMADEIVAKIIQA